MNINRIWYNKYNNDLFVISMREPLYPGFDHLPIINKMVLPNQANLGKEYHTELVLSSSDIIKLHRKLSGIIKKEGL